MSREKSGFASVRFELNPLDGRLCIGWYSSSWSKFELTTFLRNAELLRLPKAVLWILNRIQEGKNGVKSKKKALLWIRIRIQEGKNGLRRKQRCGSGSAWIRIDFFPAGSYSRRPKITIKKKRRRVFCFDCCFFFLFWWLDAVLWIRDVYPGSEFFTFRIQGWQDPGSGSA
jgi:hypothetical protein